jgi:Transposase domain (DUF772)
VAKSYRPVGRDQPFLLPPDMREWLPADHVVWFVLETVEALDTSVFHIRRGLGGIGAAGYDPDMLLALLIYAYCQGVRSSRQIERRCLTDVAWRCRVPASRGCVGSYSCAVQIVRVSSVKAVSRRRVWRGVGGEFVVAAAEVLHERVAGGDSCGRAEAFESAHRP